eukprot:4454947-Amphidinium_carterae.1
MERAGTAMRLPAQRLNKRISSTANSKGPRSPSHVLPTRFCNTRWEQRCQSHEACHGAQLIRSRLQGR